MKILKFKTNVDSSDSIAHVAQFLNQDKTISKWDIDPNSEDNVLSVSGENPNPQKIEDALQSAGFKAEMLRVLGSSGEGM